MVRVRSRVRVRVRVRVWVRVRVRVGICSCYPFVTRSSHHNWNMPDCHTEDCNPDDTLLPNISR